MEEARGGEEGEELRIYDRKWFGCKKWRLWELCLSGPQMLLKKVAQLQEAWAQKDKFIHSSRMIIRFREEHISRLERKLKTGQSAVSDTESQALIDQLKKEIKILSDQVMQWKGFYSFYLIHS